MADESAVLRGGKYDGRRVRVASTCQILTVTEGPPEDRGYHLYGRLRGGRDPAVFAFSSAWTGDYAARHIAIAAAKGADDQARAKPCRP